MRYLAPVYFMRTIKGSYNASTGDYDSSVVMSTRYHAALMDISEQRQQTLFGELRPSAKMMVIQGHYSEPIDYVLVGQKRYSVFKHRVLEREETFILQEVSRAK